ncbi:hypothetical protein BGZ67_002186 [Mortierella alpina]|nr:hypothetical protein BGZ67_002186 [Mortierella alpina]
MSTVPQDSPAQERQPLLQEHESGGRIPVQTSSETVVIIQDQRDAGQPSQSSLVKVDRLQHHREMVRERFSVNWWLEWTIIIFVFSVTGSSTMLVVKPVLKALGLTGSIIAGPWTFRIIYIILTLPIYSCMLLLVSSLFCRRLYFENLLIRMWGRLLPSCLINRCSRREPAP